MVPSFLDPISQVKRNENFKILLFYLYNNRTFLVHSPVNDCAKIKFDYLSESVQVHTCNCRDPSVIRKSIIKLRKFIKRFFSCTNQIGLIEQSINKC